MEYIYLLHEMGMQNILTKKSLTLNRIYYSSADGNINSFQVY